MSYENPTYTEMYQMSEDDLLRKPCKGDKMRVKFQQVSYDGGRTFVESKVVVDWDLGIFNGPSSSFNGIYKSGHYAVKQVVYNGKRWVVKS